MKCHKCKFDNQKNEKFCLNCGISLKEIQTSVDNSGDNQLNLSWIGYLLVGLVLIFALLVLFGVIEIADEEDPLPEDTPSFILTPVAEIPQPEPSPTPFAGISSQIIALAVI